jgi:arylsulfatase A-like enzyme
VIVIAVACAALLRTVPAVAAGDANAKAGSPPNIVLIVADDLGWNAVGYHDGFAKTPSIDRIAQQGVQLDRFYVAPMCSPTRVGLLTGRYAIHLGMARSVVWPWNRYGLSPSEQTLPEALAERGYAHRGAFGKWHLGHLEPQWHPLRQGFTEFTGQYNGASDYGTREREGQIDWHQNDEPIQPKGYTTDLIAAAASDFIARHAPDGPYFCYAPFTAPHEPLQAAEKYVAKYSHLDDKPNDGKPSDKQKLAAMIEAMDDGIGRILAAIEKSGAADNTVVWFMSDNGGIGRIPGNNTPLRDAKLTVYEGGVRVPSAVWWPGRIAGGRKITAPVVHVDVLPTLLAITGDKAPAKSDKPLDGLDVSALLTTDSPAAAAAATERDLYLFHGQHGANNEPIAVIDADGWKLVVQGPSLKRTGKLTAKHRVELFNVLEDPSEKTDHAADHSQIVAKLAKKLVAFRQSEPADPMPLTRRPEDFQPPKNWENALSKRPPGKPANTSAKLNATSQARKPDMVLFIADDLTWNDIGPYGSTDVRTPHLDELARDSLRFDQAFSASPSCTPSRSAMYTGLFPVRNGAHANHSRVKRGVRSLPLYLQEIGYRVVIAGKTHIGPRPQFPFEYLQGSNVLPPGETSVLKTDLGVDAIDHMLATHDRSQPLCLVVSAHSPHTVWPENTSYDPAALKLPPYILDTPATRQWRARYYTDVTQLDTEVGQVRDSLQRHGYDDALFLFTSDQGAQWPFAKWNLYDAGIKVPLFAYWPGKAPAGQSTAAIVSLVDLLPTMLEAAGGEAPANLDGRSFMPVLTGASDSHRQEIFASHTGDGEMNQAPMRCVRTLRFKYIQNLAPHIKYTTHVSKGEGASEYWKSWVDAAATNPEAARLIERYEHRPAEELYDLEADPFELHNLAENPAYAQQRTELRKKLDTWRLQQGEDLQKVLMPKDADLARLLYNQ